MAAKQEIIYGSGKEAGFIFFPLKGEGVYAEMKLQKDGKYKPTGNLLSQEEVQKRLSKSTKSVKVKNVDKKTAVKINVELAGVIKSIEKSTSSLPDEQKLNKMLNDVKRQVIIGEQVIPEMVNAIGKISGSLNKASGQIRNMEREMAAYADPMYVKRQMLKFNVAVAKKDSEIAQIDFQRAQLDKSSPKYSADMAALDLKEAMAMSKFATTVGKMTDPLLNLRKSITTRVDAMASTIKSVVGSVNKIASLKVPDINTKTMRQIGRTVNKAYREAFKILNTINSGMSVEVIKAKMGWMDSGMNRYVTVTKTDSNGNPYKVYLTKKEYDQKTGLMKDVKIENPDWYQPHFAAEDSMFMVCNFITKAMELVDNINKLGKYKINSPLKTSIKMRFLARSIKKLVSTTAKSFSSIDSVGIRYAISTLVGNETTLTTTNTTQSPEGVVDQINSVMTNKQPGVVSAMMALMSTIKYITDMDFGPITIRSLKARIRIRRAGKSIRKLMKTLIGVFPVSKEVDPKHGIDYDLIYDSSMQVSQTISAVRDQFNQISDEIDDLSELMVTRKTARRARRRIRMTIIRYVRIFDVIIETINKKEIAKKREECVELLRGMADDISAVVTLVDKMGALKTVSKKAIRHKRRLRLIKETLLEFKDMLVSLSKDYNPQDLATANNIVGSVSGILPVFISDMLYVINKADKLTDQETVMDDILETIRSYTHVTEEIIKILPLYNELDPKNVVMGNQAIKVFIKSLPTMTKAYEKVSEFGKKGGMKKTEFDSAIRVFGLIGELTTMLVDLGKVKTMIGIVMGRSSVKLVIGVFDSFTTENTENIKNTAKLSTDMNKVIVVFKKLVDLIEILNKIKFNKKKRVEKAIDNTLSIVNDIDIKFAKRKQKSIKNAHKTIVMIKGMLADFLLVELELTAIALLAVGAWAGSKLGRWVIAGMILMFKEFDLLMKTTKGVGKRQRKKLRDIAALLGTLILIELELTAIAVLALPAIIGAGLAAALLLSLGVVMIAMNFVLRVSSGIGKNARRKLFNITLILGELVLIELELVAIGLLAIPASIGAVAAVLMLGLIIPILLVLDAFKKNIAFGALALIAVNTALLVTAMVYAEISRLLADWDWMMLLKIPSMVLGMAWPLIVLGIPIVAGLTALGSLVMLFVAYTYKKIIETIVEMSKLNIDDAIKTIDNVSTVLEHMEKGVSPKNIKNFTSVVAGLETVSGMINSYSKMLGLIQRIAEMKIPTGYDDDGNPLGYTRLNSSVFKDTKISINAISDIMVYMAQKMEEMDQATTPKHLRRGKREMKIITRTIKPINKILDFIKKLSVDSYDLPMYEYRYGSNGEVIIDEKSGTVQRVNLAEFLRRQKPVVLSTIDAMFDIMDSIQQRMDDIAGEGRENVRHARRGKNIIKKINKTTKPINHILNFIRELSMDEYKLPIYSIAGGDDAVSETINGKGYKSEGIKKVNLAEFLRTQEPIILGTVDSMFRIISRIGDKIEEFGKENETGTRMSDTRRGKRRLKVLDRAKGPIDDILNFIRQLSSDKYTLPIYGTTYNDKGEITSLDGLIETREVDLAKYLREQEPIIMQTIDVMFRIMDKIATKVTDLGNKETHGKLLQTRRGKRRLKVITQTMEPINDILTFIKSLTDEYTFPVYNEDGTLDIANNPGGEGVLPGYKKANIGEYIRSREPIISSNIESMFRLINLIGQQMVQLGGGYTEDTSDDWSKKGAKKARKRLKIIGDTVEPLNGILDFIIKMETGYVDVPVIDPNTGEYVLNSDGEQVIKPMAMSQIVADSAKATGTVTTLLGIVNSIASTIDEFSKQKGGGIKEVSEKNVKKVTMITDVLKPVLEYVSSLHDLKAKTGKILDSEDKNNLFNITSMAVKSIDKMFTLKVMTTGKDDFKDKANRLETLYKRIKDFSTLKAADGFKDAVRATGEMVDSINAINDSKIDKLNTLMVNMTKFGETVDEALKEVFDKVVELAEELHYIIEDNEKKNNPEEYKKQKELEEKQQQQQQPKQQQQNIVPTKVNTAEIERLLGEISTGVKTLSGTVDRGVVQVTDVVP